MKQKILRSAMVFVVMLAVLFAVQWIKYGDPLGAFQYSLFWSSVSAAVFFVAQLYYARKGSRCAMCDDGQREYE